MLQTADAVAANPWKQCLVCERKISFGSAGEFRRHLRTHHCSKEGGSYVCRYGRHGVCPTLPIEGVSDVDYEAHVMKCHIHLGGRGFSEDKPSKEVKMIPPFEVSDCNSWISKSCQNLSAVQNDPKTYGRQSHFFIKTWGESFVPQDVVPLTLLPNIPKKYFESFLKRMEFKQMNHEKLKRSAAPGSLTSLSHHAADGTSTTTGQAARRFGQEKISEEDDIIPEIFMQNTFNLEEASTFNAVIPWSCVQQGKERPTSGRAGGVGNKTSSKLLQEKLTHYLDITEVKLATQIAQRSEDFFSAMSSQDRLQDDVRGTCQDVQKLRARVEDIREKIVKSPFNAMRLFRMKTRYMVVYNKLKLMATIHQTQSTIQLLLATSGFVSALDLIAATQEVLEQELAGVQSFRHLGSQLSEMQNVIEKMMGSDFVETAVINLTTANEATESLTTIYEEDRMVSALRGLLQQRKFRFLQNYKDAAYGLIKSSIKQNLHSRITVHATENENESNAAREALRSLSHQAWLDLLGGAFHGALRILQQMRLIHETILCILLEYSEEMRAREVEKEGQEGKSSSLFLKSSDCQQLKTESKELLWSACELAQIRCSKIITARSKDGTLDQLTSTEFVSLARVVEGFVLDCERVCGRQSHNLRGTLLSQAKRFVEKFHEERKHKLDLILENERWKQADVPVELQEMVDLICDGMDDGLALSMTSAKPNEKAAKKHLVVKKQQFAVVGTLLILIKMIVEYCQCVEDVPMLTTEIMAKLFELMKIYNSKSCQLVLGAGALQLVGLQRITAKHLALAAQCLEVVILLIPVFKSHFEMRLPPKHYVLLSQFDNILKDFGNHRQEILSKIVHLMEELFTNQLERWEVRPPMPSAAMRGIVRQVLKLKESLATVLSDDQLEIIFRDIQRAFRDCLAERLSHLGVLNDGGPQQGLVMSDLAFFEDNLKSCPGLRDSRKSFSSIWTIVREKRKKMNVNIPDRGKK